MVTRELERALGISHRQARRIVEDEQGEPIVVAAKAMSMPADVLQRILLFMNPRIGQSVDRVYELAALYNEISVEAACRLIAILRAADTAVRKREADRRAWHAAAESARRALSEIATAPAGAPRHAARAAGAKRRTFLIRDRHATTLSMKWRPSLSSTSTIQTSGSNRVSRKPLFDLLLRHRIVAEASAEGAIGRARVVEGGLRRRPEQVGGAVEPVELEEDGAGFLGATPAHDREGALAVAAADIGRHPDRGFEPHRSLRRPHDGYSDRLRLFQRAAGDGGKLAHDAVGNLAGDRELALALEFLDRGLGLADR